MTAVQLSRFGRADRGLTFDFAPLSEEDKTKLAAYQQTRAGVLTSLLDGGVISPEEARKALSSDADSGFSGIDPDDVPEQRDGEDGGPGDMDGMSELEGVPGMGPAPEPEEPSAAPESQNPKGDIPR